MACTTTSSYKENIYNFDIEQTISVIINNKTVDPSFVKAIKYDDKIFEVESISIGNAVAREIQLELSNQFTEEFTEVSLSSTLHIETPETLALGTYMVVEKDNSNDYYTKYILHDYMDKFHKKYDASSMVPCTRFALLQSICNYCGVELENSSIINGDVIVNTYDNTIEALEYVRCIAERAAGNAKITRYNKLKIKELNTNENIILPNEMIGDYSYDDQKIITKVIFENATQKFEKGNNTGECICLSQYSPFSCTQEEVNNIFQSLNGLTYQSLKARIWGDPSVDAGDRLTYGNIKSFAQMSWQWGNGFYGEYDCSLKTNQQTSLVERLSNSQKIRRIKSILDESNMQIDLLLEENDENKTSIANLNLNLESIKSSVTKKIEDLENDTSPIAAQKGVKSATIYDAAEKSIMWQKTYGKSTQKTRSGYNLVKNGNKFKGACGCAAGITGSLTNEGYQQFDVETGNSNWTTGWFYSINQEIEENLSEGDTFTIMFTMRRTEGISVPPKIYIKNGMGYYSMIGTLSTEFSVVYYTGTWKDTNSIGPHLGFGGLTGTFIIKNWMIKKGGLEEWEDYGVMPSPDYPSPIESVGRKNLFDGIFELGIINGNTGENFENNSYVRSKNYIPVEELTNYKFSSIDYTDSINIYEYKADFSYNLTTNKQITLSSHLTTNKDTKYIKFRPTSATTNLNLRFQLEKGSVATDYVPYEHTEINATVTGKNLFDLEGYILSRGSTYTKNSDGSFLVNTDGPLYKNPYQFSETDIDVSLSGLITLGTATYARIQLLNNKNDVIGEITSSSPTLLNKKACKIRFNWTKQGTFTLKDVMLEKGSVATDYEEYKSNSLTIDLQGNELCSLPKKIKDEVNITNGEALLNKKLKKAVFDGSDDEGWTLYPNKTHTFALNMGQTIDKHDIAYCSRFTEISPDKFGVANGIYSAYTNTIIISYLDCDTIDEFKTWLSTHNVEVLYELAEPEEIDLGKIDLPNAYRGINHITFTELSDFYYYRDNALNEIYVSKDENEKQIRNINENFAKQEITNNSIIQRVQETNETMSNNYALKEEVSSEIQHTKNSLTIEFNEQIEDLQNKQVDTLKNQLVTIDVNGIAVSTNTSAIKTIMNNDRFAIKSGDTEAFYVGYDENLKKSVSRMNDLTITDYFTAGYHRQERFEIDGEKRTGWFYVGGE